MFLLTDPEGLIAAKRYFEENVPATTPLAARLLTKVAESQSLSSSFEINDPWELRAGRNDYKLLSDIYLSTRALDSSGTLYVLDPWSDQEDNFISKVEERFLPSIVLKVDTLYNVNIDKLEKSFRQCLSFVTVWFVEREAETSELEYVAISAFDQEGCLVWQELQ